MNHDNITTADTVQDIFAYNLLINTNIPNDPETMNMASKETFGLVVNITSTNPMTNMMFVISEANGDVDSIHFGKPIVEFGKAFRFSDSKERCVHLSEKRSSSGMIISKFQLTLPNCALKVSQCNKGDGKFLVL